jgi:hypothetical protein
VPSERKELEIRCSRAAEQLNREDENRRLRETPVVKRSSPDEGLTEFGIDVP